MDEEDLEALGYAAGMRTRLPFAYLNSSAPSAPSAPSSASLSQLMNIQLHEQMIANVSESIGEFPSLKQREQGLEESSGKAENHRLSSPML